MIIDSIGNGIVIDHIKAGKCMEIYQLLNLEKLECSVAIIKNVTSSKMGKKDIIKIDQEMDLNLGVLGYVDPDCTANIIKESVIINKYKPQLPTQLVNVLFCKNPRCIVTTEQEIKHIFKLTDIDKRIYRCIYCETEGKSSEE